MSECVSFWRVPGVQTFVPGDGALSPSGSVLCFSRPNHIPSYNEWESQLATRQALSESTVLSEATKQKLASSLHCHTSEKGGSKGRMRGKDEGGHSPHSIALERAFSFTRVWIDRQASVDFNGGNGVGDGGGASSGNMHWNVQPTAVSVWRPELPTGFVRFGDFAHNGHTRPPLPSINRQRGSGVVGNSIADVESACTCGGPCGPPLVARDHPLFIRPRGFELQWGDKDCGLWVWRPLPPTKDYVSLGSVCSTSGTPPPVDIVRCVALSGAAEIAVGGQIWTDKGLARFACPVSFWLLPGLHTFAVSSSHSRCKDRDGGGGTGKG